MTYPVARREHVVDLIHGREVADPYRWLEDADSAQTGAWLAEQAALLAAHREGWTEREWFRRRLTRLTSVGVVGTPVFAGGREFAMRRSPGQDHAVLRVDGRILIDPNEIDPSGATTLDWWFPSKEGDRLAYGLSVGGSEQPLLTVIDVDSGETLDGPIGRMRNPMLSWERGGGAFYYTRFLESSEDGQPWLHRRLYRHTLGTDPDGDELVMGEGAPAGRSFAASVSHDGRWLTVRSRQGTDPRADIYLADLRKPELELVAFQVGVDAMTFTVFRGDTIYLLTDRDAPRGRVCVTSADDFRHWRDLVVAEEGTVIESMAVLDGMASPMLVVATASHAVSHLSYHDLGSGERLGELPLPGLGQVTTLSVDPGRRDRVYFRYTDYAKPPTVCCFDGATVTEHAVPDAVVPVELDVRQVTYPSKDGTEVHMFVISPPGVEGPVPCVLYGYGGFSLTQRPGYSEEAIAWVESGGAWVVAGLRGGGEEGEQWHRDGMLGNKQNVFDDFLAASDWLVDNGITSRDSLALMGGSNGGLLVGAALTQRPEACAAVVCSAPLLDMVRYERFGLGMTWSGEYGRAAVAEEFAWLIGYSPYHRVEAGRAYPAVLLSVFDGDSRVDPMHARKMAAALQCATTGGPVLLRVDSHVGHGSRAVSKAVGMWADRLGFVSASLHHRAG